MREVLGELQNTPGVDGLSAIPTTVKASSLYDCSVDDSFTNTENIASKTSSQGTTPTASPVYSTAAYPQSPPYDASPTEAAYRSSPLKRSPIKYRIQDNAVAMDSPPASPARQTLRFNEGITRAIDCMQYDQGSRKSSLNNANTTTLNEDMSTIHEHAQQNGHRDDTVQSDMTFDIGRTHEEYTIGDLSTISAIPADMARFANLSNSPTKVDQQDGWTPRANRNSIAISTPAIGQRPLLLSRRSTGSGSDHGDEATPRQTRSSVDQNDLMNFTGQTNILIPPPGPTPRTSRRSPSGRGAFPIRVNPTPAHRSQASVDRERASGRSPQRQFQESQTVPSTPAGRTSQSSNGFGMDLLDIDLGPIATPRSIPTVTPRELENLRSELQSRVSGLEATLAGKEAEVTALKKSITDAEIRAGKSSEEVLQERAEKEHVQAQRDELDRRAREMENVLREVKQNAFVEEREREKLKRQAEEADARTEEYEVKVLELTASLETLRSQRVSSSSNPLHSSGPTTPGSAVDVDAAVKNATETVARELHALYKSKHERKVGDLKLSYEKRWMKQVDALKSDLKQSQEEVSRLLTERDTNMTDVIPSQPEAVSKMEGQIEELRRWNEDLSAQKKVVEAEMAGTKSELDAIKRENEHIRADLETERIEKGDLVAQVEVFLSVSAEQEIQREAEKAEREARERERQPVSPPRSDASGESTASNVLPVQSPNKARTTNGVNGTGGRARPMSMLVKPATKFGSGIPGPGTSGLKAPLTRPGSMYQRGSLMDGINRMGAGSR